MSNHGVDFQSRGKGFGSVGGKVAAMGTGLGAAFNPCCGLLLAGKLMKAHPLPHPYASGLPKSWALRPTSLSDKTRDVGPALAELCILRSSHR